MNTRDDGELPLVQPLSEASGLCGGPGQISCEEANELVQFYVDQLADPEARARMAEHVGDCPPCEFEVVVYQRIIASLGRCRPDVPPDTAARLSRYCQELHDGLHDRDPIED